MFVNDPVSDMIARIRNAHMRSKETVEVIYSKLCASILDVMIKDGYVSSYKVEDVRKNIQKIVVELKYFEGKPAIKHMERVSKPGRRVYSKVDKLLGVFNGLGTQILSTPNGVMSDDQARQEHVGGELLLSIY